MATKVLQINPQLFKTNGKNNTSKNREKKQKPEGYKGPSTLRKALLGKIRDFQKKEQENNKIELEAKNNTRNVEEIKDLAFYNCKNLVTISLPVGIYLFRE